MTRRKNDPEGNRARIVSAAFDLFTSEGYGATSMLAVRDQAGLSSGALAYHFPAKHDLGLAVIREPLTAAIEKTWITPVTQAEDTYAGIRSVFDATIANADHCGVVSGCPLGNLAAELSTQDGDFRSEIHKLYGRWKQAIAVRLQEDSPSLSRDYRNPEQVADFVVAAFSGAILMAKASQTRPRFDPAGPNESATESQGG